MAEPANKIKTLSPDSEKTLSPDSEKTLSLDSEKTLSPDSDSDIQMDNDEIINHTRESSPVLNKPKSRNLIKTPVKGENGLNRRDSDGGPRSLRSNQRTTRSGRSLDG